MTEGTPVRDTLVQMNEGTLERSGLDPATFMLARIAALAAAGAPPASYLVNLEAASELGVSPEQVQGVLVAIAPVVGGAAKQQPQARSLAPSASPSSWASWLRRTPERRRRTPEE